MSNLFKDSSTRNIELNCNDYYNKLNDFMIEKVANICYENMINNDDRKNLIKNSNDKLILVNTLINNGSCEDELNNIILKNTLIDEFKEKEVIKNKSKRFKL